MFRMNDVSIRFGNGPNVVANTTVEVNKGDKLAVIGETGSGKSVLLLAALRLLPKSAIVSGEILFENKDLLSSSKKEIENIRGRAISYIPQGSGNGLNPLYTIGHQLCEAISLRQKAPKAEALIQAERLLKRFGFTDIRALCKAYPFMLSGGMRQRVLIAMAIAAGARLVFADEPTKGLDSARIKMVVDAFKGLQDQTVLCVTHDLRFAKTISNRIAVMYASQQIESSDCERFFSSPLHPYSAAMLKALPENGLNAGIGFAPPRTSVEAKRRDGCGFSERCPDFHDSCREPPPMFSYGDRKVRCWLYGR